MVKPPARLFNRQLLVLMPVEVQNNTRNFQFEVELDGERAEMQYRMRNSTMYLMHTKVPDAFRGKGVASTLARHALEYARDNGHKIAVLCPFVASYVKRHPEWYDHYDTNFHKGDFRNQ